MAEEYESKIDSLLGLLGFSCLDLGSHARRQVPRVTLLIPKREIHVAHVSRYKELQGFQPTLHFFIFES